MNAHHVDVHQPGHFPCPGEKCGKVIFTIQFVQEKRNLKSPLKFGQWLDSLSGVHQQE